jgi:hypothetical protein
VTAPGPSGSLTPPTGRQLARLAVSELFLDTELDDADFLRLRDALRASHLSLQELDEVYYDEVAPVLYQNLRTPAGAWEGFDRAWLEERIDHRASERRLPFPAAWRRYYFSRSTIGDWQRLRKLLAAG